ncbi:MAG TPA: TraB/GumN family protein [Rhodanobacteraceae bacterium]|nr:TraB/GumN family protein [Rhodanobacteraceae bacterium]
MRSTPAFIVAFLLADATASAQNANQATTAELPTVVVSGEQPGPGLWKVSSGDHVLWILGTLSPLPKDMRWKSHEVEDVIASAQEVLDPPRVKMDANVGFFGKMALLPALVGVRDNPDHKTLSDVVPPELYGRWLALKTKYFGAGRGRNIETWRPIFAAIELWNQAIKKAGLTRSDIAGDVVRDAAKRAKLEAVTPTYTVEVDDPRAAVKEFKKGEMDDLECFRKTLDRIDSDLDAMAVRANAWATGDVATLRTLPDSDQREACIAAVTGSDLARERGIADLPDRVESAWLDAASAALAKNAVTFARLPITDLLAADGYVAKLKAKGYAVEAPDDAGVSTD